MCASSFSSGRGTREKSAPAKSSARRVKVAGEEAKLLTFPFLLLRLPKIPARDSPGSLRMDTNQSVSRPEKWTREKGMDVLGGDVSAAVRVTLPLRHLSAEALLCLWFMRKRRRF